METKTKKLPKSVRRHIRQEKARIRRQVIDEQEREKLIQQLYQKFIRPLGSNKSE